MFVNDFEASGFLARNCNSSFISLISKINDHLFKRLLVRWILWVVCIRLSPRFLPIDLKIFWTRSLVRSNRLILVVGVFLMNLFYLIKFACGPKVGKKKVLIFKVDFNKIFDSLSWEFLDSVMEQMNFGWKWRKWIRVVFPLARRRFWLMRHLLRSSILV